MEHTISQTEAEVLRTLAFAKRLPSGTAAPGGLTVEGNMVQTVGVAKIIAGGAAYSVTPADHGATVETATDNAVITLPEITAAMKGMRIRVQNMAADAGALVSIKPNAADKIVGSVVGVTGAGAATVIQSSGGDGKYWENTKATCNQGDYTDLECDGDHTWKIVGGIGEWASKA